LVEDLGTEFGVEVAESGETASHVFQGQVVVKIEGAGDVGRGTGYEKSEIRNQKSEIILSAGQSARVEKDQISGQLKLTSGPQAALSVHEQEKFVRRLREPPKELDLLDIVAGGNGLGRRRERGIDPTSGSYEPQFFVGHRANGNQYHTVVWNRLIDGVFVPVGGDGAVQLDSAGHTFDGFPKTAGGCYGSLWVRAADISAENSVPGQQSWMYVLGRNERLMPAGRGLLCMHANQAITFDLKEIRRLYRSLRPTRFQAMAGVGDATSSSPTANGMADFWVFVDGRLMQKRLRQTPQESPFRIDVNLGPQDQFLTLAVTDGGEGGAKHFYDWDWAVFGDPVLEMSPTTTDRKEGQTIN
jgi:hypothetical protein